MKKNREFDAGYTCVFKIMRIMRLCVFFMFLFIAQTWATSIYSQETRLSIKLNNVKVLDVLNEIEKGSEFYFFFTEKLVDVNRNVNINVKNVKIEDILQNLFQNSDITYKVIDRQIILTKKTSGNSSMVEDGRTLFGKVTDSTGASLPGVSVVVKGTTTGTITNADGKFSITNVQENSVLQFSFVGMKSQEIAVGSKATIDVTLVEDAIGIEEVVAVGYGTQKKVNLTGAVASVSGESLTNRPLSNTSTMLQSQIPGLRVLQGRGQPGNDNTQIRVRGQGTYSSAGSNPLILINGVEGDLNTLDPSIIESVSVLKDAASASIYGSRAANGVILVTTKNGAAVKDKMIISYNGNLGIYSPIGLLDLVWDSPTYMKYFNIAKINSGSPQSQMYTQDMIDSYTNPTDKQKYPSFNWIDHMFGNSLVQQHNVTAAGTTEKTSYNISMSLLDQPGTMKGTNYKRYNVTTNLTSQITNFIKLGAYITGSRGQREQTRQGDVDAYRSTISQAPTYMPWLSDDGTGEQQWSLAAYVFEVQNKNMEAIIATDNMRRDISTDVNGQIWLDTKLAKGLSWYTKTAIRFSHNQYKDWRTLPTPQYYTQSGIFGRFLDSGGTGLISNMTASTYTNLYSYLKYNYETANNHHKFSIMSGYSQESQKNDMLQGYRQKYEFNLQELNAGLPTVQEATGDMNQWALMSSFSRLNYSYKDRYLLEANIRYDGSSRIASEYRWGLFPAFSAGWRLNEEPFIKNLSWKWLNNAKLRGSYGKMGNQNIDNYSYYALLTSNINYSYDNTNLSTGVAQTAYNNRNLKWESTFITNIGLDATLFRGLDITVDWYKKRTTDILRRAQVSDNLGLTGPYINNGEMTNKGIELDVKYNGNVNYGSLKGLNYNASFSIDHSINELTKFGAQEFGNGLIRKEGLPYNSFYVWDAIGIFKDQNDVNSSPKQFTDNTMPGDIKYRDVSGPNGTPDGIIDGNDRVVVDDRFPDFEYGITLSANWKGFDFSILGQGVQGVKHYADGWGLQPFKQGSPPTYEYVNNMWTENNPNGKYPRLYFDNMGGIKNTRESDYWLFDGSYLRLKNITFGYTLPFHWTQQAHINKFRLYFSAENILTFTKYPRGGDPDRINDSQKGSALTVYPQNKIISFGLNVEF